MIATIVSLAIIAIVVMVVREIGAGRIEPAAGDRVLRRDGADDQPDEPLLDLPGRLLARAGRRERASSQVLDLPHRSDDPPGAVPLRTGRRRHPVRTRALRLQRDGPPVLEDFNAEMLHGETVALVGPSGAGKSTIVNLVPRFYAPQGGRITLDGIDIATVRLDDLRGAIALVPQETQLFNGTIADNIRYGRLEADDDEVLAAAREANVARVRPASPGRLCHPGRRARASGSRAASASDRHRPRDPARSAHPDPGRGDQRAR